MKISSHKFSLLSFGLLIFLINGSLYSADFEVEVNTGLSYDSNVFRSFSEPKGDTYFTLAPKASLKIPFSKTFLSSDLRAALEKHVNETSADLQELLFSGLGRYNLSEFLSFGLSDEFVVSGRLRSAEKLTDYTKHREFVDNNIASSIKYKFKPAVLITSLEYANTIRSYNDTEKDNWITHSGNIQVEYIIGHLTSAQLSFGLIRKLYEADINYFSFPINTAIKRKLSSKINSSLSVGFENRQYNETLNEYSWSKPVVILDIVGKFTPKTDSRLILQHRVYDSDIETGYSFTSTAADGSLVIDLKYNMELHLQGLFSRSNYIKIDRNDNVLGGRVEIKYRFSRWGSVVLGYGYERRTTDISKNLFNQHTIDIYYVVTL